MSLIYKLKKMTYLLKDVMKNKFDNYVCQEKLWQFVENKKI